MKIVQIMYILCIWTKFQHFSRANMDRSIVKVSSVKSLLVRVFGRNLLCLFRWLFLDRLCHIMPACQSLSDNFLWLFRSSACKLFRINSIVLFWQNGKIGINPGSIHIFMIHAQLHGCVRNCCAKQIICDSKLISLNKSSELGKLCHFNIPPEQRSILQHAKRQDICLFSTFNYIQLQWRRIFDTVKAVKVTENWKAENGFRWIIKRIKSNFDKFRECDDFNMIYRRNAVLLQWRELSITTH